jgi:hypothetical protein
MHLSKEGQRQYQRGLRLLFDYLKIPRGDLEERAQVTYLTCMNLNKAVFTSYQLQSKKKKTVLIVLGVVNEWMNDYVPTISAPERRPS